MKFAICTSISALWAQEPDRCDGLVDERVYPRLRGGDAVMLHVGLFFRILLQLFPYLRLLAFHVEEVVPYLKGKADRIAEGREAPSAPAFARCPTMAPVRTDALIRALVLLRCMKLTILFVPALPS